MRLNSKVAAVSAALLGLGDAQSPSQATRQVAIIGAGAAGSSAAYFLQNFTAAAGVDVNITLFEKTDHIGGRTLTINAFNDPAQPFELGASIFVEQNEILVNAVAEFGLSTKEPATDASPVTGIWDGNGFVFTIDQSKPSWYNTLKVTLRYGVTAPQRAQQLAASVIGQFLQIYSAPFFPFPSLTKLAHDTGLVNETGVTGQQLLDANGVGALYSHDIIQASTRVNYASNLAVLHGLDTMVSLAAEGAMAVQGGNWQIFSDMAHASGAILALNTTVVGIAKSQGSGASRQAQYTVQTASSNSPGTTTTHPVAFDNVILANPYQFSGISANGVLQTPIDEIPYVQLHVTIFTSPSWLSSQFFGLPPSQKAPGMVLTTLAPTDSPTSGAEGVGKAGFFSISNLGQATNPQTRQQEYVYKIFSPEAVTPDFLSRLLGTPVPATFTGSNSPITWYYPHLFNSYPKAYPRVTFQDPVVGQGVYYTSGMESFISTMETNALMGKNVARLLADEILGVNSSSGEAVEARDGKRKGRGKDGKQKFLVWGKGE